MKKKFALAIAILLVALVVFAGCAQEDYTMTPLEGNTEGEVISNGGLAVIKGDYLYFVNGSPLSYTGNNTYGQVEIGSILRISLTNFRQAMMSSNSAEVILNTSKVLVPKMVYSENTSAKHLNGIYIFGDRIYYTTPDTTLDRDGAPMSKRLALKSCKLDGTDTMHHYIFDTANYQISLSEKNGKVYAMFVMNSNLYLLDLSGENVNPTAVYEGITRIVYDNNGNAYFTDNSYDIYYYGVGGQAVKVVDNPTVEGQSMTTVNFALKNVDNGVLYYTANATYDFSKQGTFSVNAQGKITKHMTYIPSNFMGYDGKLLIVENNAINLYSENTNTQLVKESESITLLYVKDGIIVYTCDGDTKYVQAGGEAKKITSVETISNWSQIDICGEFAFFIAAESEVVGYSIMAIDIAADTLQAAKIVMRGYIPKPKN